MYEERSSHGAKVDAALHVLLESLLKGLGDRVTPALKQAMCARGLDLDHPPERISIDEWVVHRRRLALLAFPGVPAEEATRLLGLHFIRGWKRTALGATTSAVISMLGPRRTLTRLDRAFRTTDPTTRSTTEFVSEHEALVTIDDVRGDPHFWLGVVQAGGELLRRSTQVEIHAYTPPSVILRVTWK